LFIVRIGSKEIKVDDATGGLGGTCRLGIKLENFRTGKREKVSPNAQKTLND